MIYNDKVLKLKQCENEFCPFEIFQQIATSLIPHNFEEECKTKNSKL